MVVYVIAGTVALVVALALWWFWRRWMWDNIFGVCMVSCLTFKLAPLRIRVADLLDVQMQEGPSGLVIIALAILHFLTVQRRQRKLAEEEARRSAGGWGGGGLGMEYPMPHREPSIILILGRALWVLKPR